VALTRPVRVPDMRPASSSVLDDLAARNAGRERRGNGQKVDDSMLVTMIFGGSRAMACQDGIVVLREIMDSGQR